MSDSKEFVDLYTELQAKRPTQVSRETMLQGLRAFPNLKKPEEVLDGKPLYQHLIDNYLWTTTYLGYLPLDRYLKLHITNGDQVQFWRIQKVKIDNETYFVWRSDLQEDGSFLYEKASVISSSYCNVWFWRFVVSGGTLRIGLILMVPNCAWNNDPDSDLYWLKKWSDLAAAFGVVVGEETGMTRPGTHKEKQLATSRLGRQRFNHVNLYFYGFPTGCRITDSAGTNYGTGKWDFIGTKLNEICSKAEIYNSDEVPVRMGEHSRYYCGRRNMYRCPYGCDGQCGPSNGCPCMSCRQLNEQHGLKPYLHHPRGTVVVDQSCPCHGTGRYQSSASCDSCRSRDVVVHACPNIDLCRRCWLSANAIRNYPDYLWREIPK